MYVCIQNSVRDPNITRHVQQVHFLLDFLAPTRISSDVFLMENYEFVAVT